MEPIELNYVPPPPSRNRGELPGQYHENVTNWNEHYGQMYPNPPQQPQQSHYLYPPMQHPPLRLLMDAAGYNKTSAVDGNNNKISIGGNLSNSSNNVHLKVFPAIVSMPIVPRHKTRVRLEK